MRIRWRILFLTVILAGHCLAADPPKPAGHRVLPAVQLTSSAGTVVNVAEMGNTGHWLLLYVHARNNSGAELLEQLKADKYGALASQIVVVVGGIKADALAEWAK